MNFRTVGLAAALYLAWGATASAQTVELRQTLDKYCAGCHSARVKTSATAGGVVLNDADLAAVAKDPVLWEKVIRKLRTGAMPPSGMSPSRTIRSKSSRRC